MAEGEFALVKRHLEAAIKNPVSSRNIVENENEGYTMLADLAVQQRDETTLRHYAPLTEERPCVMVTNCIRLSPIEPGGWRTGWQGNTPRQKPG